MTDSMMTIIGIFVAVILMVIFPLIEVTGKNDDIAQTAVQMAVADFVNEVSTNGKITERDYNKLIQKIYATGNSYDVIIEAKILDENPERKTIVSQGTTTQLQTKESQYYSVYTAEILKELKSNDMEFLLKKDDYIHVSLKNTSITLGTQLKGMFYKFLGKNNYTIGAEATSLVINTGVPEKKEIQITQKPDNLYWYFNMTKLTTIMTAEKVDAFNVIYIMDYSGSMDITNIKKMHTTLKEQIQTLLNYAIANPALQFKVSVVAFANYAAEVVNITVNSTYDINNLQSTLTYIEGQWVPPFTYSGAASGLDGGLKIRSDISRKYPGGKSNYTYNPGNSDNPNSLYPGTSYFAAGFVGKEVLKKMNSTSSNGTYIIFMTDGQNEDGIDALSTVHDEELTATDYKIYFQNFKDDTAGIYIVKYNVDGLSSSETTKINNDLNWCIQDAKKGEIFSANYSNLSNIFEEITNSIITTTDRRDIPITGNKTKLEGLDTSMPIIVKITYDSNGTATTLDNSITINDAVNAMIVTQDVDGNYYLDTNALEEYYKDQIIAGEEEAIAVSVYITYHAIET